MHKNIALALMVLLTTGLLSNSSSAAIYKTVDKDGNVIFTDVPPKDKSETVKVETNNTYKETVSPAADVGTTAQASEDLDSETPAETVYTGLSIVSPTQDEAVRENAGNLTILVSADPDVDTGNGHRLEVLMDGAVIGSPSGGSMTLSNVDRGTHQLNAQIVNSDGEVLIRSSAIEFHMLRASRLINPKPSPAQPKSRPTN